MTIKTKQLACHVEVLEVMVLIFRSFLSFGKVIEILGGGLVMTIMTNNDEK